MWIQLAMSSGFTVARIAVLSQVKVEAAHFSPFRADEAEM